MTGQPGEATNNEKYALAPPTKTHLLPPELSVFIPTRNKCRNVESMIAGLTHALDAIRWEAIFVDENSPDGTIIAVMKIAQPSELSRGWIQFAHRIDSLGRANNANWMATANYSLTGELAFHLRYRSRVWERSASGTDTRSSRPSNTSRANTFHDCFEHITPIESLDRVSGQHSLERYMIYLAATPTIALEDGTCVRRVETFTRRDLKPTMDVP